MKLAFNQLARHLQQDALAPVYVISGDEPLLAQEAADGIRQAAQREGFAEREVFSVDNGFDWRHLAEAQSALSLFAQKRLIELRINSGKPGDAGASILQQYVEAPPEETLLLVSLPRLDGRTLKTRWARSLLDASSCRFIQIWPIEPQQLPGWIQQRLAREGLAADPDAVELLASRVEGNLLAAAQELEKLKLQVEGERVRVEDVRASVADNARYDIFDLTDTLLAGKAAHALHILNGLRAEGTEPPVILWALGREIRLQVSLAQLTERGIPFDKACQQQRPPIRDKRKNLLSRALQRHPQSRRLQLLLQAQQADAQIKGQSAGNVWNTLNTLCLSMAGLETPLASRN